MGKTKAIEKLPPVEQLRGRPVGRILMKMGVLSRDKVHECLNIQKQRGGNVRIGQIFLELGLVDEAQLQIALAAKRGMEYTSIEGVDIPPDVIEKVPAQMAKTYRIDSSIQTGKKLGMQLLDEHLWQLYDTGKINLEEMLDKGRQPGVLQEKAMAKMAGAKGKMKKKAEEAAKELEDLGPILRT